MDWIGHFVLALLIKLVYPASISTTPTVTVTDKNEELKTSNSYQVTENIIDVPDNRTQPPIIPNFTLVKPLNYGNNTVITNNNAEGNNNTVITNNNVEGNDNSGEDSSEENDNNKNDSGGKLKKNSFSILHIKAEYDDKPVQTQHHNVFSKVIGGVKDYIYSLKKGVIDGLHSFFHKHDDSDKSDKESAFHNKFHRNIYDVEDFGNEYDYYDYDESKEHLGI